MGNLKDFGTSTILTPPSPANSGTSLVVQVGHGARFPATPFYATAHPPFEFPTLDNAEKVLVTDVDGDEFTIVREEGDTSAQNIEAGWRISNSLFLGDIPADFDDLTDGSTNKAFTSTLKSKLDNIESNADVTDATNVAAAGAVMESDTSTANMDFVLDEDNMASDSNTKLATQQSIKAYIDTSISNAKQALFPVGSYYINETNSTNPGTLLGFGTWTAVTDKFIVGRGSTYTGTGGSASHAHTLSAAGQARIYATGNVLYQVGSGVGFTSTARGTGLTTSSYSTSVSNSSALMGDTDSTSNVPPYQAAYVWKRTA